MRSIIRGMLFLAMLMASKASSAGSISLVTLPRGGYSIELSGEISSGDNKALMALIRANAEKIPRTSTVQLDSPGGDVLEALALAKTIGMVGLSVVVADGKTCASSCFLLFVGAPERWSGGNSLLLVHRPYLSGGASNVAAYPEESERTDKSILLVRTYLESRAVPSSLIDKMMKLSSAEAYRLTTNDVTDIGVMDAVTEEEATKNCGFSNHTIYQHTVQETLECLRGISLIRRYQFLITLVGLKEAQRIFHESLPALGALPGEVH